MLLIIFLKFCREHTETQRNRAAIDEGERPEPGILDSQEREAGTGISVAGAEQGGKRVSHLLILPLRLLI